MFIRLVNFDWKQIKFARLSWLYFVQIDKTILSYPSIIEDVSISFDS